MHTELIVDDYSRQQGIVSASSRASTPLTFETEATRSARMARAKQTRQAMGDTGDMGDLMWGTIRKSQQESGTGTLRLQAGPFRSAASRPAYASDRNTATGQNPVRLPVNELTMARTKCTYTLANTPDSPESWRSALQQHSVAAESGSSDPETYFRLAVLLRKANGDLRQILTHLRTATRLRPDRVEYLRELAEVYDELGFSSNAHRQREQIQQLQQERAAPKQRWRFW